MGIIKTAEGDVKVPFDNEELSLIGRAFHARLALVKKHKSLDFAQPLENLCLKMDIPWLYGLHNRAKALRIIQESLKEVVAFQTNTPSLLDRYQIRDEIEMIRTSIQTLLSYSQEKKNERNKRRRK